MTTFLDSVLPTQGTYCVVGINAAQTSRLTSQTFHTTTADVDAAATAHDAAGTDAYFALASFKDNTSRRVDNVSHLRSFFLDLDCGTGKPYVDQADAAQALAKFLQDTGLPLPTIVNSGGGLHVYWPVTRDLTLDEWAPMAKALKALCKKHNLHADPAVTSDAARILRVPGTHNYKQPTPRLVAIVGMGVESDVNDLAACFGTPIVDLSAAKAYGMDATSKDVAGGDYPACNFGRIVRKSMKGTGCNQMKIAVETAATLEEPLWRGVLSIAVRCEDGADAIHKVSQGHPEYTAEATEAKAAETKGPYTCQWYKDNYSAGCAGCTHNIASPILIGKKIEAAQPENDAYIVEAALDGGEEESSKVTIEIPAYPFPYFRGVNGGVYMKSRGADGEETEIEIYRSDIYVTGRFFDSDEHGDGDGEIVLINLHMAKDGVRRFYTPVTALFAKDKMRDLLIKNGVIAYGKTLDLLMAYFASSIRKLQSQYAANKTRSQMGWTPDMAGFVVGDLEYTATGVKLAPPSSGTRQLAPAFTPRGSLEEWRKMANFYNHKGLEPHALAFYFGFGSPLLKLMDNINVKGLMVNLKSNSSGSGKTTVQMMVNSIYGHPTQLLMTKDDTYASKMHHMGMMNSICVTIDEITNMKDEEFSDTAYGGTTGRARHRMEAQTNRLRTNNTTWCNFTLSSANSSMLDKLAQLKSTADGEIRRVFEYEVPKIAVMSKQQIDDVFGPLALNYGVAGPVFIQYVVTHTDGVRRMLTKMQDKIDQELGFDQSDRYYSCGLACAFTAALIAKKCGLIDHDITRIYQYAIATTRQMKATQDALIGNAAMVAQETLTAFINENVNNALVIDLAAKGALPPAPIQAPRGQLRMRYEPNTKELFITASEFRKFFTTKQVDVRESLRHLSEAGIVKNNGVAEVKRIGAGAVGSMSGLGVRCYVFDGAAIGVDENHFKQADTDTP